LHSKIYLVGYMAVGKTTIGKKLANALRYNFIDLDWMIENKENQSIANIFDTKGESYFREIERQTLLDTFEMTKTIIACGGGTPCYSDNMALIKEHGFPIWIKAPIPYILQRVLNNPSKRPLLKNLDKVALHHKIEEQITAREPFYAKASLIFDVESTKQEDFITFVKKLT
jgi:shikimate kinase